LKETRQLKKDTHIFDMKYLFIPINVGSHYTCVVVYMEDKRICYYDSYKSTKSRLGVNAGKENQMSILTIELEYLKTKHSEIKRVALPGEWKLEPMCSEIQQANTKDCGVFVCMYIDFIHDGC
jgi:Ulp1 family protease